MNCNAEMVKVVEKWTSQTKYNVSQVLKQFKNWVGTYHDENEYDHDIADARNFDKKLSQPTSNEPNVENQQKNQVIHDQNENMVEKNIMKNLKASEMCLHYNLADTKKTINKMKDKGMRNKIRNRSTTRKTKSKRKHSDNTNANDDEKVDFIDDVFLKDPIAASKHNYCRIDLSGSLVKALNPMCFEFCVAASPKAKVSILQMVIASLFVVSLGFDEIIYLLNTKKFNVSDDFYEEDEWYHGSIRTLLIFG